MQLMPATAQAIADARGIADHDASALDEPAYNLDFGAYLMAEHLRTFGGDVPEERAVELAAAAYNGGLGRVRAWLSGEAELSEETRRYTQKVVSLYRARQSEPAGR
jgi:soluble lytic murein transglycosylase-like protein